MFTFEVGMGVVMSTNDTSDTGGIVVARSSSVTSENSYLVRYVSTSGETSEAWCGEGALKAAVEAAAVSENSTGAKASKATTRSSISLKEHTMKAVRIHDYGDASVLRYEDAPEPAFAPDEVLVRVVGTSVNPVDWKIRQGHLKDMLPFSMPFIPGWDVSGIVHAVGAQVRRFKPGDAVYGRPDIARNGTYAEYVAVRESELANKPRTISHIEAGVLPLAGITAWEAVVTAGGVQAGQRVLVHAAAGGVGSLAIQIAKARGAHVIGTASGGNRALVESLGVDQFIDYKTQELQDAGRNVDLVIDTIGGQVQHDSFAVMGPEAMLVSTVGDPTTDPARRHGQRAKGIFIQPNVPVLDQLTMMVDDGPLRVVICAEFGLKDIRRAHALSESGHAVGKIAIYVGQP